MDAMRKAHESSCRPEVLRRLLRSKAAELMVLEAQSAGRWRDGERALQWEVQAR